MEFITKETADDLDLIRRILVAEGFDKLEKITRLQSGSRSVAYYADKYIVRFPKDEIIWHSMQREKVIIDTVYSSLMPDFKGKIQKIELIEGTHPFSVSKRIDGKICDGRPESEYATLYQNLNAEQQKSLAQSIAVFFNLMHRIDYKTLKIPALREELSAWDVTTRDDFDYALVRQMLLDNSKGKIDLASYLVDKPNNELAFCHNDLAGSNLLINPAKDDVLQGIIDFANADIVPKYFDFFSLYKIDCKLAHDTLTFYNKLTSSKIAQEQIDYLALTYIGYGFYKTKDSPSPYFMKLIKPFL